GDETSVVRIHSGNGPHEEMDRRAIACFDRALEDVGLTAAEPLRQVLHDYFAWATTTTMSRYHESADDVPEGLSIPRWSWDGPQPESSVEGVSAARLADTAPAASTGSHHQPGPPPSRSNPTPPGPADLPPQPHHDRPPTKPTGRTARSAT